MATPTTIALVKLVLPSGTLDGILVMLKAYFDDAGTHEGSPVVVLGGPIGTIPDWEYFAESWKARLANPLPEASKPPLTQFHLSPCLNGQGEFAYYKPVEREAVARNFRDIIHRSKLASTASAVDRSAWDELVIGSTRDLLGDAIQPCFIHCLDRATDLTPDGYEIAIMFDEGIANERLHKIIDLYKAYSAREIKRDFCSVTFGKVRKILPLQGADIIATESYWHWLATNGSTEPRPPFISFIERMPAEGLTLDRAEIEKTCVKLAASD
jgi:hypothetical protein